MLYEKLNLPNTRYIMKPAISVLRESGAGSVIRNIPNISFQGEVNEYGEMVIDTGKAAKDFIEALQGIGEISFIDDSKVAKQEKQWNERIEKFIENHKDFRTGKIVKYTPYEEKKKREDEEYFEKKYGIKLDDVEKLKEGKEKQVAQGAS